MNDLTYKTQRIPRSFYREVVFFFVLRVQKIDPERQEKANRFTVTNFLRVQKPQIDVSNLKSSYFHQLNKNLCSKTDKSCSSSVQYKVDEQFKS